MNRVAVIDDSDINLTLLNALVKKIGDCEPILFQESPKGLAWCTENVPDLVIVDYMMPEMDGMELIKRLRKVEGREDIPILMITANDDKDVRYDALQIGATDFLNKPVDRVEFSVRMKNLLALNASRKKLADRADWLAEEVKKATAAVHEREQELLYRMSRAAEFRDPETGAHIQRIAHYSKISTVQLGLSVAEQDLIMQASPMHDVGKIGIPDNILLKPGKLTVEEFEIMKRHASIGYELLSESESVILQAAAEIAHSHHEKFNGSGYPNGLKGEAIPLFGRIVAVVDVFDALTSVRPYKEAWSLERAADFIRENIGTHFCPTSANAFLSCWDGIVKVHASHQDQNRIILRIKNGGFSRGL